MPDGDTWEAAAAVERRQRTLLQAVSARWTDITEFLGEAS